MTLKLLKYDFRCMFKQFAIVWPTALVIALISGLVQSGPGGLNFSGPTSTIILLLFVGVMIAMSVISIVFVLTRFNSGLLRDEGYLMFTLPVTPVQLIFSKLLTALVVACISGIIGLMSLLLLGLNYISIPTLFGDIWDFIVRVNDVEPRWWIAGLELVIAVLATIAGQILEIYLCIAIGHLFQRHRTAAAIVAYVLLSSVKSQLLNALGRLFGNTGLLSWIYNSSAFASSAYALLFYIGIMLVSCVIYFAGTAYILSRKLNLE